MLTNTVAEKVGNGNSCHTQPGSTELQINVSLKQKKLYLRLTSVKETPRQLAVAVHLLHIYEPGDLFYVKLISLGG